ncbi:MAG: prephenate dehydrogenase [Candidatus Altiarchaeales archaeon]|nr:prephenate dehydrogenase [Candidatus Altiarchaeales archaeon]MBD3416223.1 prephenate dehydrogenase [Candidatus Altiarchaeales archaeon]
MVVRVVIVGGYGGMGQLFARLFKGEGCDVCITGPTERKGRKAAKELGVAYEKDNVTAVKEADVVVITVPIAVTADTIKEVAPAVNEGSLLMDLTSVKGWPCQLMAEHAGKAVEVIGTHPVFGPRVGSVDGQIFVLTPVRGKKWLSWLRDILERHNARIIDSTPEEHDEVMAVVQGLTHFAYISVGKTLKDLELDVKRSRHFSSPVYELMLDMIGRIIGQDPHLYAEIQMQNPRVIDVHNAFLKASGDLSSAVREKREPEFVEMMAEAARHFGDTERSMGRSDKAIGSLVAELKTLKNSIGEEMCLRHMYSGVLHYGVVEAVSADEVVLLDGGKRNVLKLSNLQVLGDAEMFDYKLGKYGTTSRDYSVILAEGADETFISELIVEDNDRVSSVAVKDIYQGEKLGEGVKSVCFGVEFIQEDVKGTDMELKDFFTRIGGRLR